MNASIVPVELIQAILALIFILIFILTALYYGTDDRRWPPGGP
jgi:hypothetical protein